MRQSSKMTTAPDSARRWDVWLVVTQKKQKYRKDTAHHSSPEGGYNKTSSATEGHFNAFEIIIPPLSMFLRQLPLYGQPRRWNQGFAFVNSFIEAEVWPREGVRRGDSSAGRSAEVRRTDGRKLESRYLCLLIFLCI